MIRLNANMNNLHGLKNAARQIVPPFAPPQQRIPVTPAQLEHLTDAATRSFISNHNRPLMVLENLERKGLIEQFSVDATDRKKVIYKFFITTLGVWALNQRQDTPDTPYTCGIITNHAAQGYLGPDDYWRFMWVGSVSEFYRLAQLEALPRVTYGDTGYIHHDACAVINGVSIMVDKVQRLPNGDFELSSNVEEIHDEQDVHMFCPIDLSIWE